MKIIHRNYEDKYRAQEVISVKPQVNAQSENSLDIHK